MAFACIVAISPLFLIGLGLAALAVFAQQDLLIPADSAGAWRLLGLLTAVGLLLNNALFLMSESIAASIVIGGCLSAISILVNFRACVNLMKRLLSSRAVFCAVLILSFSLGALILLEPLRDWDARSIWFFHAKIFFFNKSALSTVGLNNPIFAFSHLDYPILVPALAAQLATCGNYWNEYLPKVSGWLVTLPGLFFLMSHSQRRWSFLFLLLFQLFAVIPFIVSGVMDGFVALYGSLALLQLSEETPKKIKILIVGSFCGLLLGLKNEGQLIVLSLAAAYLIESRSHLKQKFAAPSFSLVRAAWLALICFLPSVFWIAHTKQLGLKNDMKLGISSVPAIVGRMVEFKSLYHIASFFFLRSNLIYWIILFWILRRAATHFNRNLSRNHICLWFFAIYAAGLAAVYLATPYDLRWHLATSAPRTTLPLLLSLAAAAYLDLRDIESMDAKDAAVPLKNMESN